LRLQINPEYSGLNVLNGDPRRRLTIQRPLVSEEIPCPRAVSAFTCSQCHVACYQSGSHAIR